jgi:hypothetical protein
MKEVIVDAFAIAYDTGIELIISKDVFPKGFISRSGFPEAWGYRAAIEAGDPIPPEIEDSVRGCGGDPEMAYFQGDGIEDAWNDLFSKYYESCLLVARQNNRVTKRGYIKKERNAL